MTYLPAWLASAIDKADKTDAEIAATHPTAQRNLISMAVALMQCGLTEASRFPVPGLLTLMVYALLKDDEIAAAMAAEKIDQGIVWREQLLRTLARDSQNRSTKREIRLTIRTALGKEAAAAPGIEKRADSLTRAYAAFYVAVALMRRALGREEGDARIRAVLISMYMLDKDYWQQHIGGWPWAELHFTPAETMAAHQYCQQAGGFPVPAATLQ